jgi:hypothetical protein
VSDIDTAVVDSLKVLGPNGRLEKLPRGSMIGAAVVDPKRTLPGRSCEIVAQPLAQKWICWAEPFVSVLAREHEPPNGLKQGSCI